MKSRIVPIEGVSKFLKEMRVSKHCYLTLCLDGNKWCALFGNNLQEGIAGFGNTATEAVADFESQFRTNFDFPPVADRGTDWSAWVDGREECKTGRGSTEEHAIRDLLEQIEDDFEATPEEIAAREEDLDGDAGKNRPTAEG